MAIQLFCFVFTLYLMLVGLGTNDMSIILLIYKCCCFYFVRDYMTDLCFCGSFLQGDPGPPGPQGPPGAPGHLVTFK